MTEAELKEYQRKLIGDPDNGVEPELDVAQMDVNSDEYKTLRPYLIGEQEWPEYEAAAPVDTTTPPADDTATPPADAATPAIETEAPAVVEARDRIKLRETAAQAYDTEVAALQVILDEPEPEDDMSQEHVDWLRKQLRANKELNLANSKYSRARDVEDVEVGRTTIQKSEFSNTIRAIETDYPELKLVEPYDVGVGKYNAWAAKCVSESGGTDLNAAYAKFQADPEFAKKVGPLPAGHETLFIYMNAVAAQKQSGGPLDGHILSIANREGVFRAARTKAANDKAAADLIANRDADAINQRGTEQRPASIKGGQDSAPKQVVQPHERMTSEQAMEWLEHYNNDVLGKPMTAVQRVEYTRQRTIVMGILANSQALSYT